MTERMEKGGLLTRAPDAKTGTAHDGEADVVDGADAATEADEATRDGITDPDAQPRLPPREAVDNHR